MLIDLVSIILFILVETHGRVPLINVTDVKKLIDFAEQKGREA